MHDELSLRTETLTAAWHIAAQDEPPVSEEAFHTAVLSIFHALQARMDWEGCCIAHEQQCAQPWSAREEWRWGAARTVSLSQLKEALTAQWPAAYTRCVCAAPYGGRLAQYLNQRTPLRCFTYSKEVLGHHAALQACLGPWEKRCALPLRPGEAMARVVARAAAADAVQAAALHAPLERLPRRLALLAARLAEARGVYFAPHFVCPAPKWLQPIPPQLYEPVTDGGAADESRVRRAPLFLEMILEASRHGAGPTIGQPHRPLRSVLNVWVLAVASPSLPLVVRELAALLREEDPRLGVLSAQALHRRVLLAMRKMDAIARRSLAGAEAAAESARAVEEVSRSPRKQSPQGSPATSSHGASHSRISLLQSSTTTK